MLQYSAVFIYWTAFVILAVKIVDFVMHKIKSPEWMNALAVISFLGFAISIIGLIYDLNKTLFYIRLIWNMMGLILLIGIVRTMYFRKT